MKRSAFALLLPLLLFLPGCERVQRTDLGMPQGVDAGAAQSADVSAAQGTDAIAAQNTGSGMAQSSDSDDPFLSEDPVCRSNISAGDCYLCGGGMEKAIPFQWGQNNIALISLNTFEIKPIEINRYEAGQPIEEFARFGSIMGGKSKCGGFSASLAVDHNRGFATGPVYFHNDAALDSGKAADFLCGHCLNKVLPPHPERCFGVGAVNLATKEMCIFAEDLGGFTLLGDFYISCDLQNQNDDERRMELLIFYCPIRYEAESANE